MTEINQEAVKEFWEGRATLYGKAPLSSITNFADDKKTKQMDSLEKIQLMKFINIKKDKEILDIGCGVGRITMFLANHADFVLGVDYAQELLEVAWEEARRKKVYNVDFLCAPSYNFCYNRQFDKVVIFGLLSYMNDENVIKTIENAYNQLKDGSVLILKETVGTDGHFEVLDKFSEELQTNYSSIYRTSKELIKMFENVGFKLEHDEKLYQHRKETGMWFFVFEKLLKIP